MEDKLAAARKAVEDSGKPKKPSVGLFPRPITSTAPASSQLTATTHKVTDSFDAAPAYKLSFLGVGQGGGKMAAAFKALGYGRVAVCNTTDQDFTGLDASIQRHNFEIGGARKDMALAAECLTAHGEDVRDLLTRAWGVGTDYAIICAGLGGGTGSGMASGLVSIVRKHLETTEGAAKVGAIVSLPQKDEGQVQCRNALSALKALIALKVSPLIIVDNSKIDELYKRPDGTKLGLKFLYPQANLVTAQLLHTFNMLAAASSEYVTFDRSEFGQLLDGGIVVFGCCDLPVAAIKTPADISANVREQLSRSLLATVDFKTGNNAACLFVGEDEGDDSPLSRFGMDYFAAGFTQVTRLLDPESKKTNAVVHRGVYAGSDPGLQVYAMLSGLEPPMKKLAELAAEARIPGNSQQTLANYLGIG